MWYDHIDMFWGMFQVLRVAVVKWWKACYHPLSYSRVKLGRLRPLKSTKVCSFDLGYLKPWIQTIAIGWWSRWFLLYTVLYFYTIRKRPMCISTLNLVYFVDWKLSWVKLHYKHQTMSATECNFHLSRFAAGDACAQSQSGYRTWDWC